MFCENCGKLLEPDTRFGNDCGTPVAVTPATPNLYWRLRGFWTGRRYQAEHETHELGEHASHGNVAFHAEISLKTCSLHRH